MSHYICWSYWSRRISRMITILGTSFPPYDSHIKEAELRDSRVRVCLLWLRNQAPKTHTRDSFKNQHLYLQAPALPENNKGIEISQKDPRQKDHTHTPAHTYMNIHTEFWKGSCLACLPTTFRGEKNFPGRDSGACSAKKTQLWS